MRPVLIVFVVLGMCAACTAPRGALPALDADPVRPTPPGAAIAASAWSDQAFHVLAGYRTGDGDGVALGANYEYQLEDRIGLGGFADVVLSDDATVVLGGAGFFHFGDRWVFLLGPGVEIRDGNAHALARLGGWYDFEFDDFTLAPTLFVDLGNGDPALVVGVSFGF